ncbi:MAG TPA: sigma-54 dependent transcriptional regulator [Terriglobales bacterium]|nr:sigma-54 dependent transcriptional regulator [Terriglobales bacterium]
MAARILIVDDEKLLRWGMRRKCEGWGYEVTEAGSRSEALSALQKDSPDLMLLDVKLPDGSGVDFLGEIHKSLYTGPVIMVTADPKIDDVKTALRLGAFDYLAKPIDFDELGVTIANALEQRRLRDEVDTLREQERRRFDHVELIGTSPVMRRLGEFIERVAASNAAAVLLQGESGTGKDLVAQIIHQHSDRNDKSFVPVNCSAIPETLLEAELFGHEKGAFTDAKAMKRGLFEVAHHGTIFLDEIGEMPLLLQAKLLRTLEDQSLRRVGGVKDIQVDVRVIAASNRNLEEAVHAGEFREDLFYRLGVIPIFIPPLRSRRDDIPVLAKFFIEQFNRRFRKRIEGVSPEAEALMHDYAWPGNVRELKNVIQRAIILEDEDRIRPNYLPFLGGSALLNPAVAFPERAAAAGAAADEGKAVHWRPGENGRFLPELEIPAGGTSMEGIERVLVERALRQARGNQSRAARLLDISRDTMRYKMKRFGFDAPIE